MITNGKSLLEEAKWIWPQTNFFDLVNIYAHFRKDFELDNISESNVFCITADQSYRLWINGEYVTRGPARGYQAHWPYDEFEVSGYLKEGHNFISVEVYNPGISTFSYVTQTRAGLICIGKFGNLTVKSDASWISRLDPSHERDTSRYSLQLNFQEHVDIRKDNRLWIYSSALPKKGWVKPEETAYGAMPWHDLEERGIPQLQEIKTKPKAIVSKAGGKSIRGYRNCKNIVSILSGEFERIEWQAQGLHLNNECSFEIEKASKGYFRAITLDIGEMVVGPTRISVNGGKPGQILDLFFHERVSKDLAPVILKPDTVHCRMSMGNRLILAGSDDLFEFYQILGFRYITIVARENVESLKVTLEIIDTGYPYTLSGSFESSDTVLNDIWKICQRTEQVCSLDSYVDTPWREQAQWWGDARIQFWNTMAIDGDVRLLKRGIRSIAGQITPNGLTYGHAPTMAHTCILPDFSLVWILTIYDYYHQTGDLSLFEEQLPVIRKILTYFKNHAPLINGLIGYDKRYWLFLDWADLEKNGTPTLYNMWYLMTLRILTDLFKLADMPGDAETTYDEGNKLQKSIEDLLFNNNEGLFCDGIDNNGSCSNVYSVHSQTLALLLGLKPEYHKKMLDLRILPYLRGEKLDVPVPSSYWVSYVLSAAREKGYPNEALGFIKRMWAPMIPLGTCLEVFDEIVGNTSSSHAWSAHPVFHLMNLVGGVIQKDTGWKSISFDPYFDPNLTYVKVKHPTPYGLIESSWTRGNNSIDINLKLPEAVVAEILIKGHCGEVKNYFECKIPDPLTMTYRGKP